MPTPVSNPLEPPYRARRGCLAAPTTQPTPTPSSPIHPSPLPESPAKCPISADPPIRLYLVDIHVQAPDLPFCRRPLPGGRLGGGWKAASVHHQPFPPYPDRPRHALAIIPAPPFRHSCAGRNPRGKRRRAPTPNIRQRRNSLGEPSGCHNAHQTLEIAWLPVYIGMTKCGYLKARPRRSASNTSSDSTDAPSPASAASAIFCLFGPLFSRPPLPVIGIVTDGSRSQAGTSAAPL